MSQPRLQRTVGRVVRRLVSTLVALLLPAAALSLVAASPAAAAPCAFPVVCIDTMTLSTAPSSGTPRLVNLSGGAAGSLTVSVTGTGGGQMNFRVVATGPNNARRDEIGTLTAGANGTVSGSLTLDLRQGDTGVAANAGRWRVGLVKPFVEWNYNITPGAQDLWIVNGKVVAEPFTDAQWQMSASPSDWGTPVSVGATPTTMPADRSLSHQWCLQTASGCSPISGANEASYAPVSSQIGSVVRRETTASRTGLTSLTLTSPGVTVRAKVTVAPPEPTYSSDGSTYTIPVVDGVVYTVNGTVRAPGAYPTQGLLLTTVATPAPTRRLPQGNQTWVRDFRTPVVPQAPVPGEAPHSIVVPATTGVTYQVGSDVLAPGEHVLQRQFRVTATASGPTYRVVGTDRWDFDLRARITPPAPTADLAEMRYTIPDHADVEYRVGGSPVAAGEHPAGAGTLTVTAHPRDPATHQLTDGATAIWTFTFATTQVTPDAPEVGPGHVLVPDQDGVRYQSGGQTLPPGRWDVLGEVTVVAVPSRGNVVLTGTTRWDLDTIVEVVPSAPVVDHRQMTVTFPTDPAVTYTATAGLDTTPGVHSPGEGSWTVTATPTPGYRFPVGTGRWEIELAHVDRTAPAVTVNGNYLEVPESVPGVKYLLDGREVAGRTHATGRVTVEAVARAPQDRLVGTTQWHFDLRTPVQPEAPVFDAVRQEVRVPDGGGVVRYRLGGEVVGGGVHPGRGTVTVQAELLDPDQYVWTPGADTSWTFDLGPTAVTPRSPTFAPATARLTVPNSAGVVYRVGGRVLVPGAHRVPGRFTVTARATDGHRLADGARGTWTFTSALAAKSKKPKFRRKKGKLRIPAVTGLVYRVKGKLVRPGTKLKVRPGRKLVVRVSAQVGYRVTGRTRWVFKRPR